MLARRVVEHDVDAQRDPGRAQLPRECAQIFDRAQCRLDGAVVGDRVAAVVGLGARVQQRHQVQVVDAQLAQVRQPLAHPPQRAGEAIDVRGIADRLLALQPIGRDLALVVERPQLRIARGRGRRERLQQLVPCRGEALVVAVHGDQRVAQLGEEALQPPPERLVTLHVAQRLLILGAHLGTHRMDVLHDADQSPAPSVTITIVGTIRQVVHTGGACGQAYRTATYALR